MLLSKSEFTYLNKIAFTFSAFIKVTFFYFDLLNWKGRGLKYKRAKVGFERFFFQFDYSGRGSE